MNKIVNLNKSVFTWLEMPARSGVIRYLDRIRLSLAFLLVPKLMRALYVQDALIQQNVWLFKEWQRDARGKERGITRLNYRLKKLQKEVAVQNCLGHREMCAFVRTGKSVCNCGYVKKLNKVS